MMKVNLASPETCTRLRMKEPLLTSESASVSVERRGGRARTVLIFALGMGVGVAAALGAVQTAGGSDFLGRPRGTYVVEPAPSEVPPNYLASPPLNNSCLIPKLVPPTGPQTFDACEFVIKSTDEVWNTRGNVEAAIEKYFVDGYYNAGSWGRRGTGKAALKEAIYGEMRAFPDIRIHITDCSCVGNDIDGYKCMMPDLLEGTNSGPSAWGPATHRYARWTGLVESFIKRNEVTGQWQYVAEWGVHDEWALIQQLGLDFNKVPHPPLNTEPFHDCVPLLALGDEEVLDRPDRDFLWRASGGKFRV